MSRQLIELDGLRMQIDKVDTLLIQCLAKRQETVKEIAEIKKQKNLQIFCPEREQEMVGKRKALASQIDLDSDFIEDIFKKILENSKKIQGEAWKSE